MVRRNPLTTVRTHRRLKPMSNDASNAAAALAKKRWAGTTQEERTEVAKGLAAARWAGHEKKATKTAQKRRKKPSKS
jgi:hypothetical protein